MFEGDKEKYKKFLKILKMLWLKLIFKKNTGDSEGY